MRRAPAAAVGLFLAVLVLLVATPANAQEATSPSAAPAPAVPSPVPSPPPTSPAPTTPPPVPRPPLYSPALPVGQSAGWPLYRLVPARPHLGAQRPTRTPFRAEVQLTVDGRARAFRVLIPPGLTGPAPVLVVMHGLYQTREALDARTQLLRQAAVRRLIVVYPAGSSASWNAGRCCGKASADRVADVAALKRFIDEVNYAYPVNRRRIYATGFSNGGMMAYKIACDAPRYLAAIAVVSGSYVTAGTCLPKVPTPTMVVHGQRDTTVPYRGTRYSAFLRTALPSVAQSVAVMRRVNDPAGVRTLLVALPDEAHAWPSLATASRYDTTRHVLNFLTRYSR